MREELLARWVLDQVMSHYSIVNGTGVGITKVLLVNFSVSKIFDLAKAPLRLFESHLYLTGATAAELW